jgi:putative endonuclease
MAEHNKLGEHGEKLAVAWLMEKGYKILHRNWRYKQYEIDIIATKNKKLHIVEVKCRNTSFVGYPEDSVTKKKFRSLKRAAHEFIYLNAGYPWIQYDVLSIILSGVNGPEYFLLEDVFL